MSLQASLQGPILVVAASPDAELVSALAAAGAFPVIESGVADAFKAAVSVNPTAVVIDEPDAGALDAARALARHVAAAQPLVPLIVRVPDEAASLLPNALAVPRASALERLIARLGAALRLRTLHASVLGRAATLRAERNIVAELPPGDPLDQATVLVIGRGRAYPALSVAVGERMGVMGALSVDAAARCLLARDVDGLVIADGLPARSLEAFLELVSQDSRFRDLPIAVLCAGGDVAGLSNLVCAAEPAVLLQRFVPFVRMRAFEGMLKRLLRSIECKGMLDPSTGLFNEPAFARELDRAIADAGERGVPLSLARFAFEQPLDHRSSLDAARLVSRLMRDADFACRQADGSILFAFAETDLRAAHVAARRLASVLKHTMLRPGGERAGISPSVTLATLKPSDTLLTLLARVAPRPVAAA